MNVMRTSLIFAVFCVAGFLASPPFTLAAETGNDAATKGETTATTSSATTASTSATASASAQPLSGEKAIAPFEFESTYATGQDTLYSLYTAVDAVSYGYNSAPFIPSNPNPPFGATNLATTGLVLSWSGGDPDPGDTVTYDVFLDTSPNPQRLECVDLTVTQCSVSVLQLQRNTTYYWSVSAEDSQGLISNSPIFSFTTCDATCFTPTPSPIPSNTPTQIFSQTPTPIPTPGPVDLNALAPYTAGRSLQLVWRSVTGATEYYAEASTTAAFNPGTVIQNSGWVSSTSHLFRNLPEAQSLYFRVKARNANQTEGPYGTVASTIMDGTLPSIYAAGYLSSYLTASRGGTLTMLVYAQDNTVLDGVELFYQGVPTGYLLPETPDAGVYIGNIPTGAGDLPVGNLLLEFVAYDKAGNQSTVWPYFTIQNEPSAAPSADGMDAASASSTLRSLPTGLLAELGGQAKVLRNWLNDYRQAVSNGGSVAREANPLGQPEILAAGYWNTKITVQNGGNLKIVAAVVDDVTKVELYVGGSPTGVLLQDTGTNGDDAANDNLYTFSAQINGPLDPGSAGQILLELVATDGKGANSATFPYVVVGN